MHTNAIRLASQLTSKGVSTLDSQATASGVRAIIRYPYDGQRYEIIVNPLPELNADGYEIDRAVPFAVLKAGISYGSFF